MFQMLAAGGVILSMFASPLALVVPPTPPPGGMKITVVTANGSGCPVNTTAVAVSKDNTNLTVTYSAFLAQVGVGAKATDARKNCQVNLDVTVPQGFTYAIAKVDYRGFASLQKGASGTEKASYYFTGMSPTGGQTKKFNGPLEDNWQVTDEVPITALVWSPCGAKRNLNINTEVRVDAGTSDPKTTTSFMNMDSTDVDISTVYHFSWQQCPKR